jgi:GT2 family glycosyltransferase
MALDDPRACIVVPLHCGPDQALQCLEGIAAQGDDPAFEVIVVDDASTGLQPLLEQLDGDVRVLRNDRRVGLAGSLHRALHDVRADTVVILRDAAVPAPGWLAGLIDALEDPDVAVAFSVSGGDPATPALTAHAAALRTGRLRQLAMPSVADELLLGALGLALAGEGRAPVVAGSSVTPSPRRRAAVHDPGTTPELTVVIPTLDATADRVQRCLRSIAATTEVAHEVVIVDNGSPPQGFSAPVNAGIRAARTPYIVVMNDDVEPEPGWWRPLRAALDAGAAVAFPLTVDSDMRTDFAAWCFAVGRDAVPEFGHTDTEFLDPSLPVWFQDTDLLMSLRAAGRPPVLVRDSTIRHGLSKTLGSADPRLSAWVRSRMDLDKQRFEAKHPGVELTKRYMSA